MSISNLQNGVYIEQILQDNGILENNNFIPTYSPSSPPNGNFQDVSPIIKYAYYTNINGLINIYIFGNATVGTVGAANNFTFLISDLPFPINNSLSLVNFIGQFYQTDAAISTNGIICAYAKPTLINNQIQVQASLDQSATLNTSKFNYSFVISYYI